MLHSKPARFVSGLALALATSLACVLACSAKVDGKAAEQEASDATQSTEVQSKEKDAKAPVVTSLPSKGEIEAAPIDDIFEMLGSMISDVQGVLVGVTDVESATAALPALEKIAGSARSIGVRRDALLQASSNPAGKLKLAQMSMRLMGNVTDLGKQAQRLEAIPGASDVLNDVMGRIFGTLSIQ